MKKLILILLILFWASSAFAQLPLTGAGKGAPGGGGSPTFTNTTAVVNGSCTFSATCTISSVTVPAGFIVAIGSIQEGGVGSGSITQIQVCGTTLTLDSANTIPTSGTGAAIAHGTTAGGSCSVVITHSSGNISSAGIALGLLSNLASSTPGTACGNQYPFSQGTPYPCTGGLTVGAGGFGIVGIATGNATVPSSAGTLIVDATASNSGGTTMTIGIGHVTASFATGANIWTAASFANVGIVGEPFL